MSERNVIGYDTSNQEIIPLNDHAKLTIHTNRHTNCDGSLWGWITGCTLNICWSENASFNLISATKLVKTWNDRVKKELEKSGWNVR